ncbi:hypothetical protein [Sphingopyxis sp. LC363]|uniref:hypothetical protein n=1 Tax=Sphingopyxis sp. LC363 TaxID=1120705 RepID=UPI0009DE7500|nr:hypothetical protein [Sphingopyxis sp. LC363]
MVSNGPGRINQAFSVRSSTWPKSQLRADWAQLSKRKVMMLRAFPLPTLARTALFAVLALMLVLRVGPLCEAVAVAAVPSAATMVDCEGKSHRAPDNKAPAPACSMPCASAFQGEPIAHVAPLPFAAIVPWPGRQANLAGLARAPATPPPRAA